jgi:hypothetical protein
MSFGGGGTNVTGSYDPQVASAAAASTAAGSAASGFANDYFNSSLLPLVQSENTQASQVAGEANNQYNLDYGQEQAQAGIVNGYGDQAERNYYNMVQNYSAPGYASQQAGLAMGDVAASAANNNNQLNAQLSSYGINPNSGAAIAARSTNALQDTAAQAAAGTQARNAAQSLGMQLTEGAANQATNTAGLETGFGNAALGAAGTGAGVLSNAASAATGAASVPMSGYSSALQAAGNNENAYGSLDGSSINANAQAEAASSSGFGSLIGALGGGLLTGGTGSAAGMFANFLGKEL